MSSIPFEAAFRKNPFAPISRSFLDDPSLPFAPVLPAEIVELAFRKYDSLFGGKRAVSSRSPSASSPPPPVGRLSFTRASAQRKRVIATERQLRTPAWQRPAAVSRIAAFCIALGKTPPDEDTGNYCRARASLQVEALADLVRLIAKNTETISPDIWLWKNKHHAKLVDGFTATMPDTEKNQRRFSQHNQDPDCAYLKHRPIRPARDMEQTATVASRDGRLPSAASDPPPVGRLPFTRTSARRKRVIPTVRKHHTPPWQMVVGTWSWTSARSNGR